MSGQITGGLADYPRRIIGPGTHQHPGRQGVVEVFDGSAGNAGLILLGVQLIDVVVETPRGSRNKYEIEEETGLVWLDRRLPGAFAFPADYGYVPGALGSDDEPLDALVLTIEPTYPGVRVRARPIGVFWVLTGHGREAKLVCVPEGEPAYIEVDDLSQLPAHQLAEIANFFDIYRSLDPDSETQCHGYEGAAAAQRILTQAGVNCTGTGTGEQARPADPTGSLT
jgi:inorganic pyrophosphatase